MKQLDPNAVWIFFLSFVFRWFFLIIILSVWGAAMSSGVADANTKIEESWSFLNWLWIVIPVFLAICFIWAKLTYKYYRYELTEKGFRKESGVIYKKYVTIPYDRIQNIDIYRGILARILGLSDLQIQTAGMSAVVGQYAMSGMGSEGRLAAISKEVAEQLRDELVDRSRNSRHQGL